MVHDKKKYKKNKNHTENGNHNIHKTRLVG